MSMFVVVLYFPFLSIVLSFVFTVSSFDDFVAFAVVLFDRKIICLWLLGFAGLCKFYASLLPACHFLHMVITKEEEAAKFPI